MKPASVATLVLSLLFLYSGQSVTAQQKHRGSPEKLATDVIFLLDGTILYGVVIDESDDATRLVISRDWLKSNYPQLHREVSEQELREGVRIQEQLVKRIEKWLEARADEDNLRLFLEDERERALSRWQNPEVPETRFTILTIARSDIRRTVLQTADSRSMAIHGWANNLQDVEITPAGELYDELSTSGADLSQTIDFSRDLPERLQSDDDWALRQGIVEYVLAKSLEFQGVGDQFFRTDERIDPMMLMGQMLQNNNPLQQLGEELEMPEFRNSRDQRQETESGDWWREQAEIADKEGFRVFAITRLNHSLRDPVVKVQTLLVAKNSDGDWVVVHRANGEARPEDQSADALRELKRHPQVAGLVRNAGSLGMGSGIDTALRHGLATQQALVEAGAALYEFTSRYADELGGPPIIRDK